MNQPMLIEYLDYFKRDLKRNSIAHGYVVNRGLSEETITELEIGYCRNNSDSMLHRFSDRVIFPIFNVTCDLVGFGGRALGENTEKYINSPDSSLYSKSRILYNLDKAQDHILEMGYAIVVEGYFDVAVLWEYGIKNVVATCGTAMTRHQLRLLKRYADWVSICYDGDSAGTKAAARAAEGLADEKFPIKIVSLPEGMDPDEYVSKNGGIDFMRLVNG